MPVHPEVTRIAKDIRTMRIRGAGRIARAVAKALRIAAKESRATSPSSFRKEIEDSSRLLLETRPTAVSLPNAVRFVTLPLETLRGALVEELRNAIVRRADEFIQNSLDAVRRIGEIGAKRVRKGDVILTHCNSECALSIIKTAHAQGKKIHVFATESRPRRQGFITVRDLISNKIPCTLIVDSAARFFMREIDRVVVGADAITVDGSVVNKIGTSQVALAAHEAGVPFMAAAETYKLHPGARRGHDVVIEERSPSEVVDPGRFPGIRIRNPAFDVTPPKYVEVIVTERGEVSPKNVRHLMQEVFSWETARRIPSPALEDSEHI